MNKHSLKVVKRNIRHNRVKAKVRGNSARPRISVFKANKHVYAQIIDDSLGKTLVTASSLEIQPEVASAGAKLKKLNVALEVGKMLARKAEEQKIKLVVFDRGGYKYHGRVKALAQGAREGGLEF